MPQPRSTRLCSIMLSSLALGCWAPAGFACATLHAPSARAGRANLPMTRRFQIPMRPCDRQRTSVPADASARVMDLQGRCLKLLPSGAIGIAHGDLVFDWDGKTERGSAVAPGIYRLRVAAASLSLRSEQLLLVR